MSNVPDYIQEAVEASPPAAEGPPVGAASRLKDMAMSLVRLRADLEAIEELKKARQKDVDAAEYALVDAMTEDGVKNFALDEVGTFIRTSSVYASAEDKPKLLTWLKESGNGSIVKEDVHPSTLRSFVINALKEGQPVPPGVKTFTRQGITIRPAK